jgi:ubiquinone/menaquinone biosynthesis C-methylase UbiE
MKKAHANPDNMRIQEEEEFGTKILSYRKVLASLAVGRVLEVACGEGRNSRFYPLDCELTLADYLPSALEKAVMNAPRHIPVSFVLDDMLGSKLPPASFDTVVCTFGLQSTSQPEQALREMARLARRGGLLLLMERGLPGFWPEAVLLRLGEEKMVRGRGQSLTRDWDAIIRQCPGLEVLKREQKIGGKVFVYVLRRVDD